MAIGGLVESLKNKNYKENANLKDDIVLEKITNEEPEPYNIVYTSLTYASDGLHLYSENSNRMEKLFSETDIDAENTQKLEMEIEVSFEEKINYLLEYFNMKNSDAMVKFFEPFIETMLKYGIVHTFDRVLDIFYETAQIPLEEKIEFVKDVSGMNDEELNISAATYGGEAYGTGENYEDAFAVATTAENRTQYPIWMNSTESKAGAGTGGNIYYATMTGGFAAYGGYYYYQFLGNRDLQSFKATVDAIYINQKYGLYMHNCTEFNMPSATKKGTQFVSGGNRYYRELPAEDRIINENDLTLKRVI